MCEGRNGLPLDRRDRIPQHNVDRPGDARAVAEQVGAAGDPLFGLEIDEQQWRTVNGGGTGAERELHGHLDRGRPDPSDRQERQPDCARTGHVGHPFASLPHKRVDCARPMHCIPARAFIPSTSDSMTERLSDKNSLMEKKG